MTNRYIYFILKPFFLFHVNFSFSGEQLNYIKKKHPEYKTMLQTWTNTKQVERAIKLSGAFMPQRFKSIVDKFGSDPVAMKQAGIAYATDQVIDLYANGITNVHVYSMNKPDIALGIQRNLSNILGREY